MFWNSTFAFPRFLEYDLLAPNCRESRRSNMLSELGLQTGTLCSEPLLPLLSTNDANPRGELRRLE